jgi:predicted kinase/diadenosine tetraphosphatase ApaH/serine/threonine PP2A family protein phosphatase
MPGKRSLDIPTPSLVVMVGAAGSGKTTFCQRHFQPTHIVSSDACRAMIAGDEGDQGCTHDAFELAHRIAGERLGRGLLTVFDATSVEAEARRSLLGLAARHHLPAVAVVLDVPLQACVERDRARPDRQTGRAVIARQDRLLRTGIGLDGLKDEGFAAVHRLRGPAADADGVRVRLVPLPCDLSIERGPFDLIGDVHGCARELALLLRRLGYARRSSRQAFHHPQGRRAVLVGDLVDRGPQVVEAARIAMRMMAAGTALCVPGNHDVSLARALEGRGGAGTPTLGRRKSLEQVKALPAAARRRFVAEFRAFVDSLPPHLVLDGGRLAVAHAGLKSGHIGRDSEEARRFALLGEITGEVDRYGLPVRVKWAEAYRGRALVVYGHTSVARPEWVNNTVNIDTGCVYGGRLTSLRYPELEVVSLPAARAYYRSVRALPPGVGLRAETRALPSFPRRIG